MEVRGFGRTSVGIVGRDRVNALLGNGDGGGGRAVAPKVGFWGGFGDSGECVTEEPRQKNCGPETETVGTVFTVKYRVSALGQSSLLVYS